MKYILKPHQEEAVKFASTRPRVCFAMKMRSGKTLASLHTTIVERGHKDILIVCNRKGKQVWADEVKKWFDLDTIDVLTGEDAESITEIEGIVLITPRLIAKLSLSVPVDAVIVDEIHLFKGGQQFADVCEKTDDAKSVIVLSGTPANNRPKDLYSTFRILKNSYAYSPSLKEKSMQYSFLHTFCRSGTIQINGRTVHKFDGLINKELLKQIIDDAFLIYQPKKDEIRVSKRTVRVPLNDTQKLKYDELFNEYVQSLIESGDSISGVLSARQLVENIKCREYISLLKAQRAAKMIRSDERLVIFTSFLCSQNWLLENTSATQDIGIWRKFGGALVLTHRKGGVGIDLSEANKMAIIDLDVRSKDNSQSMARILGQNQKAEKVEYVFMHCPNTVDDNVAAMNKDKVVQLKKLGL